MWNYKSCTLRPGSKSEHACLSLRSFTACRDTPSLMISDNAMTFKVAAREVTNLFSDLELLTFYLVETYPICSIW